MKIKKSFTNLRNPEKMNFISTLKTCHVVLTYPELTSHQA